MARAARVFDTFAEADEANRVQYAAMSPEEPLALVFELSFRVDPG